MSFSISWATANFLSCKALQYVMEGYNPKVWPTHVLVGQLLLKTSVSPLQLYEEVFEDSFTVGGRGLPYRLEDFEAYPCLPQQPSPHKKARMGAPWYQSEADVYNLFKVSAYTSSKLFLSWRVPICRPECLQEVICSLLLGVATLIWGLWGKLSKHSTNRLIWER